MAKAMGPARGSKMDSYRGECTGMLSILRFMLRIVAQYRSKDKPWRGLIGTNSQSLLDSLYKKDGAAPYKCLADLEVLDAEWGLLVEIQEALKEMPGFDLAYVKSHQDDRVPYKRLPLMAQLNVDADKLAEKYAPNTGALLLTDDGTLTSSFKAELRNRSTGPGLENYILRK